MKSHKGKDKFKVKVEVVIKKVTNLKELNGSSVFIQWKRGSSSKSSGDTSHLMVKNGESIFDEKISFESKFFIDPKTQKPDGKKVAFSLKEEKKKSSSGKILGKIEFDVTSYLNSKSSQTVTLSFTKGIKPEPVLHCTFNIIPIKYNNKPLVKVLNRAETSKDPRLVKTIAGEDYFLDKTDSEASDTVDTSMTSDISFNDSFGDDDPNDDLGESKKELRVQLDQITKERDFAEMESGERLERVRELELEIENYKKQTRILNDTIIEHEGNIEMLQQEREHRLSEEMAGSSGGSSDIEILKQEKLEKMAVIAAQEKEITKLKKQLKQTVLSETALGSMTQTDIRTKYTALQAENENLERTIAQLEKQKSDLEEKLNAGVTMVRKRADSSGENQKDHLTSSPTTSSQPIVTKATGSVDDLRKQSLAYKTELEEKTLIERTIYLAEPQFKGNMSVSGAALFEGLISLGVLKDFKVGSRLFSSISTAFDNIYKKSLNDNSLLAYWLSTTCLVLAKIKNKIESDSSSSPSLSVNGAGGGHLYDEKSGLSPIKSFEFQLKAIIFKFYSRLVQNTYARISPVLVKSILQHDIHAFNSGRLQKRKSAPDISSPQIAMPKFTAPEPISSPPHQQQHQQHHHQQFHNQFNSNSFLDVLEEMYDILKSNFVHSDLIQQFFSQIFYFTNAVLLNSLNNIRGLCSTANGFQMKIELSKIADWSSSMGLHDSLCQLDPMIETTNVLVMDKKLLDEIEVVDQVCSSLSMHQVKHLLSLFQTDRINSEPIPNDVLRIVDQVISRRGEEEPTTLDIDLTYMHQLSLEALTKDQSYARETRGPVPHSNSSLSIPRTTSTIRR
ncbi:C2 calcium/lipid-binding region-containing protein [Cavenderia fasciculata]|uniref:C2 calcium/lipid-binding region-containing protein n=1 Tax=Cavenderia fasciculata TaxID=261658 RepID=F4PXG7_CACFS|nr:C2 calcium/lipid-binding region-containing protein [Cavenderia fasciculata]EGG19477.1 C2 calcium/lipid-binding region-containing protein [Cavenderia fasciculata]|eukprot:XP_004357771.1 C2 calcium/lipid-binding region-containing protein [Cavenderia fasciculata]